MAPVFLAFVPSLPLLFLALSRQSASCLYTTSLFWAFYRTKKALQTAWEGDILHHLQPRVPFRNHEARSGHAPLFLRTRKVLINPWLWLTNTKTVLESLVSYSSLIKTKTKIYSLLRSVAIIKAAEATASVEYVAVVGVAAHFA